MRGGHVSQRRPSKATAMTRLPALLCLGQLAASASAALPELWVGEIRADVATASQASSHTVSAQQHGGKPQSAVPAPALAWNCIDEAAADSAQVVCFFSLASLTEFTMPPAATPPTFVQDPAAPVFDTMAAARERCQGLFPGADLATPTTAQRNTAAYKVVDRLLEPHWLGATNPNTQKDSTDVTWLDDSPSKNFLPWDSASNQPNDCDGPDQPETCIFLGP